jgi:hypothetical protein
MNSTFMNSAQVFSVGIFFSLMIAGLSVALPHTLSAGLTAHGVPAAAAGQIAKLPPITILFATFLGYNPVGHLVGSKLLHSLPAASARQLTGRSFFPNLISGPFHTGLHIAFGFSIACCLIAAVASWSRGSRYVAAEHESAAAQRAAAQDALSGSGLAAAAEAGEPVEGAEPVGTTTQADGAGDARNGGPAPGEVAAAASRGRNGPEPAA